MKVTGRVGNRFVEFGGEKTRIHEKSYKAGYKAAKKFKEPDCVFDYRGCAKSFSAGYVDGMKELQGMIEHQVSVASFCKAI